MYSIDYLDAATMGTLSPHIPPIMDLKQMLSHAEETLPPTMYLPVSSEDILYFYCYLHTYRCTYTGLFTTAFNLQDFYLGYPSW